MYTQTNECLLDSLAWYNGLGKILPGLSQQGGVGLVGTEGDVGGWGQGSTGVNQVGRMEADLNKVAVPLAAGIVEARVYLLGVVSSSSKASPWLSEPQCLLRSVAGRILPNYK